MTTVTALPQSRPLTRADLAAMPDDGHRYELIDGTLIVSPAPRLRHQAAVSELCRVFRNASPPGIAVLVAPFDVVLADDTVVQPDLLVARRVDFTDGDLPVPPLLAVEVLSPSTRLFDLNLKRVRYGQAGCPAYWVIDPDRPSLTAWELRDRGYVHVAHADGEQTFTATKPFPVSVVPAELVGP